MAWPASPVAGDFWADGFEVGAVMTRRFTGASGIRQLTGPLTVVAPVPAEFDAVLTRAQFDHVALERFEGTPHSVQRGPVEQRAFPAPLLGVIFVLEGELEVRMPDASFTVAPGQALLMDTRAVATSTADGPIRLLRVLVDADRVPAALRLPHVVVPGPLAPTALLDGYRSFIDAVLRVAGTDRPAHGPSLTAAVAELTESVLAEAQQIAEFPLGASGLRYRIEAQIHQHHRDPHLDVESIALALGISVRHAHAVFNDEDRTIARALRDRRAATAAHLLRTGGGSVQLGDVARDSGFAGRESLNRAFQQLHGCTAREYAEAHRRVAR